MNKKILTPILIAVLSAGFALALFFLPGGVATAAVAFCFGFALLVIFKKQKGGKNGTSI